MVYSHRKKVEPLRGSFAGLLNGFKKPFLDNWLIELTLFDGGFDGANFVLISDDVG